MNVRTPEADRWWAEVLAYLRDAGHPVTSQREDVVRYLAGNDRHPSAAEVHAALPGASRSTVYKTMALLVRLGFADAVPSPTGELRYDPRLDDHDHFYCVACGAMTDIPAGNIQIIPPSGCEVTRRRTLLEGRCASCR